jgi:hypothetical protein
MYSNSLKQAASLNETHWDLKRRREAEKSWLAVPQSASHLVSIEDRLMYQKQPQLTTLLMRPMSKMFNKGGNNTNLKERENLWEPTIVRYIYDDINTTSQRFTKSRVIQPPVSSTNITKNSRITKKSSDSRLSQSMRRAKLMRPSTADMLLSPIRKRCTITIGSNKSSRNLRSAPAKIQSKESVACSNKKTISKASQHLTPSSIQRPYTTPVKDPHAINNNASDRGGPSFQIRLEPEHAHYNQISFGKKSKPEFGPMTNAVIQQPGVSLCRWAYIEGNRISEGNYNYFEMPDGRLSHFYSRAELKQAILPPPPITIPDPFTLSRVCPGFHHDVDEPLPSLRLPPAASKSDVVASFVLTFKFPIDIQNPPTGNINFKDQPILLHVAEVLVKPKITTTSIVAKKRWSLEKSTFAPRQMKSDARAFFDNDRVKKKAFTIDWANLTAKKKFVSMVLNTDDEGGEEEMKEVKAVLWNCYSIVMDAFEFYSVMGTSLTQAYTIQSNAFNDFVDDCKITDMATCKRKDIDTIFIVANLEEDKQSKTNKVNDDRALMRFEFLECVVRIAIAKYLKSGQTNDVSDALVLLCEQNLQENLGPEAVHDSNDFRKDRLYFEEVDKIYWKHYRKLQMIFDVFAKPKVGFSKDKLMTLSEWSTFMKCVDLYGKLYSFYVSL